MNKWVLGGFGDICCFFRFLFFFAGGEGLFPQGFPKPMSQSGKLISPKLICANVGSSQGLRQQRGFAGLRPCTSLVFFGNKTKKQSRPVMSKAMFVWGVAEQSPFWFLRGILTVLDMYVLGFVFLALFIVISGGGLQNTVCFAIIPKIEQLCLCSCVLSPTTPKSRKSFSPFRRHVVVKVDHQVCWAM